MGLLMKLFGSRQTIRFEFTDYSGNSYTGKSPIESFGCSTDEVEEELKNYIFVNEGIRVKEIKIIGVC